MSPERRKSIRFPISQFVDVSFGHEQFYNATGINVSENGMLCEVTEDIGHSRNVYILLQLPGGESLDLTGVVVRVDKEKKHSTVAVEFTELFAEDKKKIKEFISSLKNH